MTVPIPPTSSVTSIALSVIDNHSRQHAASLLADMYNKQWEYMETAMLNGDWEIAQEHSIKLVNIALIAKEHNIYRDMMSAVVATMPYKG